MRPCRGYWINEKSPSGGPDVLHTHLNTIVNVIVEAGGSKLETISYSPNILGRSIDIQSYHLNWKLGIFYTQ